MLHLSEKTGKDVKAYWECGVRNLTVKLLLTFLVLDSATLASVRSTSSKMIDWGNKEWKLKIKIKIDHLYKIWD